MQPKISETIEKVRSELDKLDENREKILSVTRQIIRNSSEIIKAVHRGEFKNLDEKIKETKGLIKKFGDINSKTAEIIGKNYFITAKQEFTEAVVMYNYVSGKSIPNFEELGVTPYEYILGLADVVGELRRKILNNIREDNFDEAEKNYEFMDDLYQLLFSLDYPSGLLPGFRGKVDADRGIIGRTLELITTSKNISVLNNNLNKILKDDKTS